MKDPLGSFLFMVVKVPGWRRGAVLAAIVTPPAIIAVAKDLDAGPPPTFSEALREAAVKDFAWLSLVGVGLWGVNRLIARSI